MKKIINKLEAIEIIGKQEQVHSFVNPNGMLIGCDLSWDSFLEKLDKASTIEMSGEQAARLNHPICLTIDNRYEFIGPSR